MSYSRSSWAVLISVIWEQLVAAMHVVDTRHELSESRHQTCPTPSIYIGLKTILSLYLFFSKYMSGVRGKIQLLNQYVTSRKIVVIIKN